MKGLRSLPAHFGPVLLLAGLALCALPDHAWAQKARAERPTYTVGEKWLRTDGVWELTRVGKDLYVFTAGKGQEIQLTKDLGIVKVVANGWVQLEIDGPPKLAWPLEVGKWGLSQGSWRGSLPVDLPRASGRYRITWKVEAYEEVQVRAGTVKAFRIVHEIELEAVVTAWSYYPVAQIVFWYSPDAGRLVKAETRGRGAASLAGLNFELGAVDMPAPPAVASPLPPGAAEKRTDLPPDVPPPSHTPPSAPVPSPPVATAPPADTEAPKIAINHPPPGAKIDREQIVVLGLVTDNVGVERVQVTVNGVEIAQPRDVAVSGRGHPIRVPAALQPGENVIEITAADKAGNIAQVVRTVTRAVPTVAQPAAPKLGNRWAVIIGVGEYEHASIPKLKYVAPDAEAMHRFLTTKGGYPKENVVLLTDTTPEKPTLQNIRRALGDFLFRKPGRDDTVLIYYAGHGAPEADATGVENDGLSKYLVPRNADPDSLYSTAFPMDEIQRIFARIPAERVVLLLDTCYSGTAGGRTFARQHTRSGNVSDQFLERLTRSRGRVIMTASGPNEVALEVPELGHGIFTYYVIEGLGGKADRNGDGIVTVSELYEYVEDKVDRRAREAGGRQRPVMKGEIEGTLPLSQVLR